MIASTKRFISGMDNRHSGLSWFMIALSIPLPKSPELCSFDASLLV
jgi:hypothetical protein